MKVLNIKESNNIAKVAYFLTKGLLLVQFLSGEVYAYGCVPPALAKGFETAESTGVYFAKYIKGAFAYKKLETPMRKSKAYQLQPSEKAMQIACGF